MLPFALHPPGDYVSDEIRRTQQPFEAVILDELVRRLTIRGVVVDAGAHIGNHTVFFADRLPHTQVHAFEPWLDNLVLLRQNVAGRDDVFVWPYALSDRPRMLQLLPDSNQGHVRVDSDGSVQVEAIALDDFELREVTLLKVDVEGHEPQVLEGAALTIARWHPLILIEDWREEYGPLLPGYQLVGDWSQTHQTYLYQWAR